ncbi:auxin efflux carrier transmembrane protein [Panus rudis PR-1116 ss-1]|nr:auxin efflux carrier transmembrane protein [Panus rudis PR-1116 ss-1]
MLSIGALIWISLRPLLRLVICVGCGFTLAKADIFPVVAARGAGQLMLNVALPCLMFSKIVPAFNSDNIGALGPLVVVSLLYQVLGLIIAWITKQVFWVPHRFRYGILVAGGWGNYGDIPTSVVMSMTASAPFDASRDQTVAIAYVSVFLLVFFLTLFPLGGHRLIAKDYVGPDVEDEEVKDLAKIRRIAIIQSWRNIPLLFRRRRRSHKQDDEESPSPALEKAINEASNEATTTAMPTVRHHASSSKHVTFSEKSNQIASPSVTENDISRVTSPEPTLTQADTVTQGDITPTAAAEKSAVPPSSNSSVGKSPEVSTAPVPQGEGQGTTLWERTKRIRKFILSLLNPPSLAITASIPIALITPLKALFVPVPNGPIPNAPDGQPPLAFIQDAATFIGQAAVPLGLICLGSALATLKVPRNEWKTLPLGAIMSLAVGKLIVTPIVGLLICQALTNVGFIDPTDKVLRFVCIFFSCLPTATTQVYLTQVYSGTGSAEHIAAFLIPQYALMLVSMIILTAYSLNLIF